MSNCSRSGNRPPETYLRARGGFGRPFSCFEGTMDGISEDALKQLVETFYARVRQDPLIGPVFNDAIHDWPEHLEKLQAFWSSVMLTTGRYKGRPMPAHVKHADRIDRASFARWLALWGEVT